MNLKGDVAIKLLSLLRCSVVEFLIQEGTGKAWASPSLASPLAVSPNPIFASAIVARTQYLELLNFLSAASVTSVPVSLRCVLSHSLQIDSTSDRTRLARTKSAIASAGSRVFAALSLSRNP